MKREIKFRIWDDAPINDGVAGVMIDMDYAMKSDYLKSALDGKYPIMQFTGLKDKTGADIWEDDIVEAIFNVHGMESSIKFNAKIIYNSNIGAFQISYRNSDDHFVSDTIYSRYFLKVIGNIYENAELI
jgi:uncharacterized phage protein (TIGR01671 family)